MFKSKISRAGFTLVEILIAMSIASIVLIAASRLMMSVLNQYTSNNADIQLQTEVEEILNLMENIIMEADDVTILNDTSNVSAQGLSSGPVLRVDQTETADDGTTSEVYYLIFQEDDNAYESKYQYDEDDGEWKNVGSREKIYMGTHVSSILFTLTESGTAVFVDVSMQNGSATYDASRKMLLRNLTSDYQNAKASASSNNADNTNGNNNKDDDDDDDDDSGTVGETLIEEDPDADWSGDDEEITVTSTTITQGSNYYTAVVTIQNNGKPIKWSDLNVRYYYNCPERYNVAVKSVTTVTNDDDSPNLECVAGSLVELDDPCESALGYIPISFSAVDADAVFYNGAYVKVTFNIGNWSETNGTWDSLYESSNISSHLLSTSYSALSTDNVLVYSDSTLLCGTAPSGSREYNPAKNIVVGDYSVSTSSDTQYTVSFSVQNQGEAISWDDLEVRFFYTCPSDKSLSFSLTSSKSSEMGTVETTYSVDNSTNYSNTYSGTSAYANNYISFVFSDGSSGSKFYNGEKIYVSFTVSYTDGSSLSATTSTRSFANSYSLKCEGCIGVYLDSSLMSGSSEPDAISATEFAPKIVGESYTYNSDNTTCTISFSVQNFGAATDCSDFEVHFYAICPGEESLKVGSLSYELNGGTGTPSASIKNISPVKDGASNYILLTIDDTLTFDTLDTITYTFTVSYESGGELENVFTTYGFPNSYSLLGEEYITVHADGDVLWGTEPTVDADDEEVIEVDENTRLIISEMTTDEGETGGTWTVTFTLYNLGSAYINLKYAQIRYFYYLSDDKTMSVSIYNGPSAGTASLSDSSTDATGYAYISWSDNTYIAPGATTQVTVYMSLSDDYHNPTYYGMEDSYSNNNGGALYYKGSLIYGSEPDNADTDNFSSYPETETPEGISFEWSYGSVSGGTVWDSSVGEYGGYAPTTTYSYGFKLKCSNLMDLDMSKFKIYIYQYYDTTGEYSVSVPDITNTQTNLSSTSYSLGTYDSSGGQYYVLLNGFDLDTYQSEIYFYLNTYMKNMYTEETDLSNCYLPDGNYPILIYYDDELIWPEEITNTWTSSGSGDSGSENTPTPTPTSTPTNTATPTPTPTAEATATPTPTATDTPTPTNTPTPVPSSGGSTSTMTPEGVYTYNFNFGSSTDGSGTRYYQGFNMGCSNLSELDMTKFEIRFYQYYGEDGLEMPTIELDYTDSNISSCTKSLVSVGDGQYYMEITDIVLTNTSASSFSFWYQTYMSGIAADTSSNYIPTGGTYPVEIYYDGVLIYPSS